LLPFILLFIGWSIDLKFTSKYYPYFIALFVLSMIASIVGIALPALGKMYIVDGQLVLSPESIIIRSTDIALNDIKKIEIKAYSYVGSRSIDGSGNTIVITNNVDEIVGCRFVIKSKDQRERLYLIIQQWASGGTEVNL
jgi:hypothetical protein